MKYKRNAVYLDEKNPIEALEDNQSMVDAMIDAVLKVDSVPQTSFRDKERRTFSSTPEKLDFTPKGPNPRSNLNSENSLRQFKGTYLQNRVTSISLYSKVLSDAGGSLSPRQAVERVKSEYYNPSEILRSRK